MSDGLRGVVVTHGTLAGALIDAVAAITGTAEGFVAISNAGCGRERLLEEIETAVGDDPAVVFVDLPSGSCLQASAIFRRSHAHVAVVAGVNLAMLLDFALHREGTPSDAAARAREVGARALQVWEP